jgi:DNA polymerase V
MFDETPPRANSDALMRVIDSINITGLGRVWFAGQRIDKGWKMKRDILSPAYTRRWKDLPTAVMRQNSLPRHNYFQAN